MKCYKLMCVSCLSPARTDQLLKYEDGSFFTLEPQHRRDFCMLILKLIQVKVLPVFRMIQLSLMVAHISPTFGKYFHIFFRDNLNV
jgi:hypothetical protein